MMLPRLKPSAIISARRVVNIIVSRDASHATTGNSNLETFREINRLAREGKWDAINCSPKISWCGRDPEAREVYNKILTPEDNFSKYGGQPYGPIIYLVSQVAGFCFIVFALCKGYELLVPEQYRLKYKYRPKHHDEHH